MDELDLDKYILHGYTEEREHTIDEFRECCDFEYVARGRAGFSRRALDICTKLCAHYAEQYEQMYAGRWPYEDAIELHELEEIRYAGEALRIFQQQLKDLEKYTRS